MDMQLKLKDQEDSAHLQKKTKGKNISDGSIQEIPDAKYIRFIPSSKLKK